MSLKKFFPKKPKKHETIDSDKIINYEVAPKYGFQGFQLYFTDEPNNVDKIIKNIRTFQQYVARKSDLFSLYDIEEKHYFSVDLKQLLQDEDFKQKWSNFNVEIINKTEICLSCMGLGVHQIIVEQYQERYNLVTATHPLPTIIARLTNVEPVLMIKNLKVVYYEKLVAVRGTVIRTSNSQLQCQYMTFKCSNCGGTQVIQQKDGVYTSPIKCLTKDCRKTSNFIPLLNSSYTRTVDYQNMQLQEVPGREKSENGRLSRTIECDLREDLVNFCNPGDDVVVTGVLKIRNSNDPLVRNKQSSVFQVYLDVISIVNEKNENQSSSTLDIIFSNKDYYTIRQIHAEPEIFRLLVHSLCPKIFGHEIVKAGLILALFGGTKNNGIRSDSHVLIVGDPGLGKSQLLKACSNVAPRGIYVCGNTSTNSGLTVTMTREGGGEFALEAGALILANQGCCCIDEFDKMPTQHACLLEVMEQQSISISKAGVVCSLPAKATVLAAANPAGGHYNKGKTISENLKISSPMLSRFDLIFVVLDQPNEEQDKLLSEHIMALHAGYKSSLKSSFASSTSTNYYKTLKEKLKLQPGEELDLLPQELLKKYIAYAQQYVHPKLSDEAKDILKKYYLDLRKHQHGNATPITNRQLEAMRRLVQARAKVELRETATAEDTVEIIEIIKNSLLDVFTDDSDVIEPTRSQTGSRMSTKKQVHRFLVLLQQKSEIELKSTFSVQELKMICEASGVRKEKFFNMLNSLNIQGFLLKKPGDNYQLVSSDLS